MIVQVLQVKLHDYDRIGSNEPLGRVYIPIREVAEAPGKALESTWKLQARSSPHPPCPDPRPPTRPLTTILCQHAPRSPPPDSASCFPWGGRLVPPKGLSPFPVAGRNVW